MRVALGYSVLILLSILFIILIFTKKKHESVVKQEAALSLIHVETGSNERLLETFKEIKKCHDSVIKKKAEKWCRAHCKTPSSDEKGICEEICPSCFGPTPGPKPSPTPGPTPGPTPSPTPGPTPSPTPGPTPDGCPTKSPGDLKKWCQQEKHTDYCKPCTPTPSPTPPTPSPTPPTPSPTPPTPSPTPPTPSPTPPTPSPTPPTPSPTPPTPSPTPPTPSPTPPTPSPAPSPTPTPTPSPTPTPKPTPTPPKPPPSPTDLNICVTPNSTGCTKLSGAYFLLRAGQGSRSEQAKGKNSSLNSWRDLQNLALAAYNIKKTNGKVGLPINRLWLAFFRPDINYKNCDDGKKQKTLDYTKWVKQNYGAADPNDTTTNWIINQHKTIDPPLQGCGFMKTNDGRNPGNSYTKTGSSDPTTELATQIYKALNGESSHPTPVTKDGGYAELKDIIELLQKNGTEVFLSMGGWNYNCNPEFYAKNSMGSYHNDLSYLDSKYSDYFNGACEPKPKSGSSVTADDYWNYFTFFPDPNFYTQSHNAPQPVPGGYLNSKVIYTNDKRPGFQQNTVQNNVQHILPGNFIPKKEWEDGGDPYTSFVTFAKNLGASGIDFDYEEFWHADTYNTDAPATPGGYNYGTETINKIKAILEMFSTELNKPETGLKFSTPAGAVNNMTEGPWWGGNLKGINNNVSGFTTYFTNSKTGGGMNVMSYDLSGDPGDPHICCSGTELPLGNSGCPSNPWPSPCNGNWGQCGGNEYNQSSVNNKILPQSCDLPTQVAFYVDTYNKEASYGIEIGQPAYPAPDKAGRIVADKKSIDKITSANPNGGFFWDVFKPGKDDQDNTVPDANYVGKAIYNSSNQNKYTSDWADWRCPDKSQTYDTTKGCH